MAKNAKELAQKFFHAELEELSDIEKKVLEQIIARKEISRNANQEYDTKMTLGEKLADKVASFGGSWTFIIILIVLMSLWIALNSFLLLSKNKIFDPYPYVLLNLALGMISSLQAPVILMSQNRASAKDRIEAQQDYEVNLKSELEILSLHEKFDTMYGKQWEDMIQSQREQIRLLTCLLDEKQKRTIH